jgi:hypothetical protein
LDLLLVYQHINNENQLKGAPNPAVRFGTATGARKKAEFIEKSILCSLFAVREDKEAENE